MPSIKAYGHDYGNSETDGVMLDGEREITRSMPSAEVTAPSQVRVKNLGVDLGKNTVFFRMLSETTTYMIGEGAIQQAKRAESHRGYISRYTSPSSIRAMLSNAACMTDEKVFSLHVVTGVPIETYAEDRSIRDKIIENLSGHYEFLLNDVERHVDVTVEKVVAEGGGIIIGFGSAESILQGVIDIGGRTTDLYVSKGQNAQLDLCKSHIIGVESVIDLLKKNFYAKYKATLTTADARAIFFAFNKNGDIPYPCISIRGTDVLIADQRAMVQEAIRVIGEQIASNIAGSWSEGETSDQVGLFLKRVYLGGRGALCFRPYIEPLFSKDQIMKLSDPGSANAAGYASLARRLMVKSLNVTSS